MPVEKGVSVIWTPLGALEGIGDLWKGFSLVGHNGETKGRENLALDCVFGVTLWTLH